MSEIDDMFGSASSEDEGPIKDAGSNDGGFDEEADVDPFADSDDEAGGGAISSKPLGRLSKGAGTEVTKKVKKLDQSNEPKLLTKGKGKKNGDKKKKKEKKRKRLSSGADGGSEAHKSKKKKKKSKIKSLGNRENAQQLEDLGLLSSGDDQGPEEIEAEEAEEEEEEAEERVVEDEDEEEVEADLEPEEKNELEDDEAEARPGKARTAEDDAFIDDTEDNPDLLAEYSHEAPPPGSDSEAEEDNGAGVHDDIPTQPSVMDAVLKSMKRRKAQELGTAEREQIAQDFMYKINKASEDDEKAVKDGRPALNKLKMLKVVKATLAKKELQETFLEFDLLGVLARWLQPYKNGHLPNLTIRKEILGLVMNLPVQVDHLKRSGIGKIIMGLLNCKEETIENKRVIRELVSKWNRPVYGQDASYRAMRSMQEEPEAIEVTSSGRTSNGARRRGGASWSHLKRDGPSHKEAIGNILNAKARGLDASQMRVPFSNGYAFSKAPRSRIESHGRQPNQPEDTSVRARLLKKMASLSRPTKKGV